MSTASHAGGPRMGRRPREDHWLGATCPLSCALSLLLLRVCPNKQHKYSSTILLSTFGLAPCSRDQSSSMKEKGVGRPASRQDSAAASWDGPQPCALLIGADVDQPGVIPGATRYISN